MIYGVIVNMQYRLQNTCYDYSITFTFIIYIIKLSFLEHNTSIQLD